MFKVFSVLQLIFSLIFLQPFTILAIENEHFQKAYSSPELNNQTEDPNSTSRPGATEEDSQEEKEGKKASDAKDQKEEKKKSPHSFTGSVSLVSDYRSRGISETIRQPAIQGGFDYAHENGAYIGTWASNVDGTGNILNNTSMEWDIYGGYKGKVFASQSNFTYNVGLLYYYYPGGEAFVPKKVKYNTLEYYIEFTYKECIVKLSETITDFFGNHSDNPPTNWKKNRSSHPNGHSRISLYIEASWTHALSPKWTLLLHGGYQTVTNYNQLAYADWLITLTREFDWLSVFMTYVGTNANPDYYDIPDHRFKYFRKHSLGAQGVVFGINHKF